MTDSDGTDHSDVDEKRRKFLLGTVTALGAVGVAGAAVPFVTSMLPSKRAQAQGGPVRVKVGQMKPGEQLTVMWRGRPVMIIRRSEQAVERLSGLTNILRDPTSTEPQQPQYARNVYRSINPNFLVLVGICTHLGCTPTYRPEPKAIDPTWPGGFLCSCHGSKFDLAGRVFKGVPAPVNMEVPPYVFISDNEILIGSDTVPKDLA